MDLQAFEVQVCAKAETRGLKVAFLVEIARPSFLLLLNCSTANQMGFEQVFDNLTSNHMDALRKQIQSCVDYVLNPLFFDISNVKQILTMIARINLLWKCYLVCFDVNERYDIRQDPFTSVFEVLHYK